MFCGGNEKIRWKIVIAPACIPPLQRNVKFNFFALWHSILSW